MGAAHFGLWAPDLVKPFCEVGGEVGGYHA